MSRIVLVNPNTDGRVTEAMLAIARDAASGEAEVAGLTVVDGVSLITDEAGLRRAADAVIALVPEIAGCGPDAIIIAAFGDPALAELREHLAMPVIGICEAAMADAAAGGRRFGVVTTTPGLGPGIARAAVAYGHGTGFAGTWFTRHAASTGSARGTAELVVDLAEACARALAEEQPDALIIGGGPLAAAARVLVGRIPVALIEPISAAVRLTLRHLHDASLKKSG